MFASNTRIRDEFCCWWEIHPTDVCVTANPLWLRCTTPRQVHRVQLMHQGTRSSLFIHSTPHTHSQWYVATPIQANDRSAGGVGGAAEATFFRVYCPQSVFVRIFSLARSRRSPPPWRIAKLRVTFVWLLGCTRFARRRLSFSSGYHVKNLALFMQHANYFNLATRRTTRNKLAKRTTFLRRAPPLQRRRLLLLNYATGSRRTCAPLRTA